jgi:hypothetical protein
LSTELQLRTERGTDRLRQQYLERLGYLPVPLRGVGASKKSFLYLARYVSSSRILRDKKTTLQVKGR